MNTSRRRAIKLGICTAASLSTIEALYEHVAHAAQQPPPPVDDNGGWLRRDLFESGRGQVMNVRRSPRSIGLQLMSVDDVPTARHTGAVGDENSFIVLFRGPRAPRLEHGTYLVANPSLSLQPGGPIEYDRHGSRLGLFRNPVDENPGSVRRNVVLPVGAF
jgi:hypothetical protein